MMVSWIVCVIVPSQFEVHSEIKAFDFAVDESAYLSTFFPL